eukprot:CAMPEP_0173382240 /NCGR_PEP_ID=MMETSP1356-20130122/4720_1 /TAXON_ID=77927 ORGANISM="Hemiselmis virescens, Strain PCC157" /NCGR_SAMPLE_ID=MMETSP1356 /ASSEMBLY_ACC=CAM_ASM_000847 /LENGTH=603 /DNA_ID=CAMNT_0014336473 /DNA_START=33 /DNA_END=1844 /DNA_ORIENTATION=-
MAIKVDEFILADLEKQLASCEIEDKKADLAAKIAAKKVELAAMKGNLVSPYSKSIYQRVPIASIFALECGGSSLIGETIVVGGWVKSGRTADKDSFAFLEINDGSAPQHLQVLIKKEICEPSQCKQTGVCIVIEGEVKAPPEGSKQTIEVHTTKLLHLGTCDAATYPIAKAKLSLEFLREKIHLRCRTNTVSAVQRVRNCLAYATHKFFQESGFQYVHTPIITGSDCEGAGEMFQITTLLHHADEAAKNPPPSPEEIESLKQKASAAGSAVADVKKAIKEAADADKPEAKKALQPALDVLMASKKAVEEAETKARQTGGLPRKPDGSIDYTNDFFGMPVAMTVSGQLQAEIYACAMTSVYTFGPTFRAENSHTTRHLAEFWMIEPEIAFADLYDDMNCAQDYVRYCCKCVLEECLDDLTLLSKMYDKGCIERVRAVVAEPFARCSYTEGVEILQKAIADGHKFENNDVQWGIDFGSEHERYLCEKVFKKPVICYNYPKAIKAFYMRGNDDGKTVASMDVLVPGVGELIGGSQREERLDVLTERIKEMNLDLEAYEWYLDLRKYGTCVHSGFGLGFERLILFVTGIENIRDVIPFPRWPGNAKG